MHPFTEKTFIGDDERVKFYTGLPKFEALKTVFDFIAPSSTKLTRFQEFILTLIKLRLDSPLKDLAYTLPLCYYSFTYFFQVAYNHGYKVSLYY